MDKENMKFDVLDFSNHPYPSATDMIVCRDMLQHNTLEDAYKTLINIEDSAKYLVTNWHHSSQVYLIRDF